MFSLLSTKPAESFSALSSQRHQDMFLHSFWVSSFHSHMLLQATLATLATLNTCGFATCCLMDGTSNLWTKWWRLLLPITLVQFLSFLYHGTSLHNILSTCLWFVQLESNFCQSLTEYIADVARTFESLISLPGRAT